jgi:L-lysine 6-transaminase
MGMYSTLAVGYSNQEVFAKADQQIINYLFANKVTNCEIDSDVLQQFLSSFESFLNKDGIFSKHHFCPTGALAIEAAVKTAIKYKSISDAQVLRFSGSFHGIYGYGGLLTDRFAPVNKRLDGFPGNFWKMIRPFYDANSAVANEGYSFEEAVVALREEFAGDKKLAAVLVEPIQCTFGDYYFDKQFLQEIRSLCTEHDVPLIFDEIQTGVYTTGTDWYFKQTGIVPDIIVFGKKLQLAGISVVEKFETIFSTPGALEATWDSNLVDMYRSSLIMDFLKHIDLSEIIARRSRLFMDALAQFPELLNIRYCGYIMAFDLASGANRDRFVKKLKENKLICNSTREKAVRFRPHLLFSENDIDQAMQRIWKSL